MFRKLFFAFLMPAIALCFFGSVLLSQFQVKSAVAASDYQELQLFTDVLTIVTGLWRY